MLSLDIRSWFNQFRKYSFTYSKGFYHLPYNGQSPQEMVKSFSQYPFVQHSKEKHCVSSNNPLCQGGFYYQEIEEGCWIVYSKMRYKTNVALDLVYNKDKGNESLANNDYYMLSLNNINNGITTNKNICERSLVFPTFSWTFFKPKVRNCDVNFKGARNRYITIYFNENWLEKTLTSNKLFSESGLIRFISSPENHFIIWPLIGNEAILNQFKIFDKAMNVNGDDEQLDILNLKFCSLNLIFDFFKFCKENNIVDRYIPVDYNDRFQLHHVENYLLSHLFEGFPGIEFLSKKFCISETQLKTKFKQIYGSPVNQYFRETQMELAKELLLENQLLIKEIAYKFGYESTGKFSIAFKKYHGLLPSELTEVSTDQTGSILPKPVLNLHH